MLLQFLMLDSFFQAVSNGLYHVTFGETFLLTYHVWCELQGFLMVTVSADVSEIFIIRFVLVWPTNYYIIDSCILKLHWFP